MRVCVCNSKVKVGGPVLTLSPDYAALCRPMPKSATRVGEDRQLRVLTVIVSLNAKIGCGD